MTMSFDELVERDKSRNIKTEIRESRAEMFRLKYPDAFEAGAQSRRDEIDELLLVGSNLLDRIKELCCERDELQKRIDDALKFYNEAKSQHNIGMIQMALLLKGNK